MLAISQKPERVSNILRSSTETTRVIGTVRGTVRVCGTFSTARALMPLLLLVGCLR